MIHLFKMDGVAGKKIIFLIPAQLKNIAVEIIELFYE